MQELPRDKRRCLRGQLPVLHQGREAQMEKSSPATT